MSRARLIALVGESRADGFSLIEVLITLVLAAIVFLAIAQTIGVSVAANKAATDYALATDFATQRLEELSQMDYDALVPGGSVAGDVGGYFDTIDSDGDGTIDYRRRWEITDLGASRRIRVQVEAVLAAFGPQKTVNLVTLIAQP
jgi:prepilin-type N-terminal cleavage/methylation domain-containing protein